jgi:peptidoglycan/LPS O-acetylase OafA/YrhL
LFFGIKYVYRQFDIGLPILVQQIAIHLYVITATILVANLSYNYVEKPFLKLKNKFAIVRSQTSIKK